ncbi:MAG: hypothetical protein IJS61_00740 [Firmicutes bacterium]|nr:hypothetical protein [Bacillota bacterium]
MKLRFICACLILTVSFSSFVPCYGDLGDFEQYNNGSSDFGEISEPIDYVVEDVDDGYTVSNRVYEVYTEEEEDTPSYTQEAAMAVSPEGLNQYVLPAVVAVVSPVFIFNSIYTDTLSITMCSYAIPMEVPLFKSLRESEVKNYAHSVY